MDSLQPGLLVVARYRLEEPLAADLLGVQPWAATDQILDRPVRVSVIEGSNTALTLDAARRAALVSDAHLTRVLDVLHDGGRDFVVTEPYLGVTLADLVEDGPLSAGAARAVIGSAAKALEAARRRGVHHGALRPSAIRIHNGVVRVTGLGIDGTVPHTRTPATGDEASREDALALVALLHYALTGVLPLAGYPTAALDPQAPTLAHLGPDDALVPPRELVPGVPNDLDTLCVVTLGPHDDGPHTPGELVQELAPWDEEDLPTPAVEPAPVPAPAETAPASTGVNRQSVRAFGSAAAPSVGATMPGTPPPAGPVRRQSTGRIPRVSTATLTGAAGAAAAGLGTVASGDAARGTAGVAAGSAGTGTASGIGAAGATTPQAAAPAHPVPPRPTTPQFGAHPPAAPSGKAPLTDSDAPLSTKERARRFHFNPTPVVLALMLGLVVVGGVIAKNTLFSGYDPAIVQPDGRPTGGAAEPGGTAGEEPTAEADPVEPAPAAVTPVITGAQQISLPGVTPDDHPELAARAVDNDAVTAWYSLTYKTANFGGLDRSVGLLVTLEQSAPVSAVYLSTNNTGGNVEIRATNASDPAGGTLLASGPLQPETTFSIDPAVETSTIVVWLTELPQVSGGEYRANIFEIAVS